MPDAKNYTITVEVLFDNDASMSTQYRASKEQIQSFSTGSWLVGRLINSSSFANQESSRVILRSPLTEIINQHIREWNGNPTTSFNKLSLPGLGVICVTSTFNL